MPVSGYFRGSGDKVLARMIRQYGKEKGTRVFYATAKEKGMEPSKKKQRAEDKAEKVKAELRRRGRSVRRG